jgi:NADPH2:quinone reductase
MKAVVLEGFGGAAVMRIADIERPKPSRDRVLIKVVATSVNRPDIVQREGHYPPPPGESEILGLEVAGVIEEIGEGVEGFEVGERVLALIGGGGYAEYATAYASHLMRIPPSMSFEQAACVCETYITAYLNLFMGAGLRDGETVLLHGGGGGVNTAGVQLCKALAPAARIIVTASPGKVERVRSLGADLVVDYRQEDFVAAVNAETEGGGADVILDHIGGPYLAKNLKSLATGGRLVVIGVMGGAKAEINLASLMVKRQRIIGSVLRPRPVEEKAAIIAQFDRIVMPLFASGRIAPLVDRVYPIEEVVAAHQAMEAGEHFGKIVLTL